jgi:PAS domain S-box-containing protein
MSGFSLPTALAAAFAVSVVLSAMLAYLCRLPGAHPALRLWTLAYIAYALRQACNLAVIDGRPGLLPVAEGLFVLFSFLLLAGTLRFTGRHVPKRPLAVGAAATMAWIVTSHVLGLGFFWQAGPAYAIAGLVLLLAAAAFRRQHGIEPGVGHGMVGALFLLLALHQFDYPFLRPVAWFAPVGFMLTAVLNLAIGLALITVTQRRQQLVAEAATVRMGRSEGELRESEARFRNMADTMPALLYMTDAQGHCLFVNKTWLGYTGRPLDAELGEGWMAQVHPDDMKIIAEQEKAAFDARQIYSFSFRLRSADGQYHWFLDHGAPRLGPDGAFLGYIGTLVDVTQQQALAEQLQQAQKMEAIGQLTGGVAHDFNNLLAIILGNLDLIDERLPADSRLRALVRDSLRAAERGAELTGRLLAFARRQPLKPEQTDVNRLVAGMTSLLRRTLGGDIRVDTVLAGDLGPVVVDPGQLESALLNLAINARDAMPGGGRLTLRTAAVTIGADAADRFGPLAPGDYVEILVSDSGTGMPAEVRARAFEPFYTTKRVGQGSGLGLSMVYGFVSQSGGHASIDSAPGRGTSVQLLLPRAMAELPAPAPALATESPSHLGRGEMILLVEDDPNVRQLAAQLLEQLGYRFIEAADGPAALAAMAEAPPIDLLFSDVVLPRGMNGIEVARRARERQPGLKVLFMSGYAEGALAPAVDGFGEFDLLHKPFRKAELAARLRRALAGPAHVESGAAPVS